jgi:hypothetical protein
MQEAKDMTTLMGEHAFEVAAAVGWGTARYPTKAVGIKIDVRFDNDPLALLVLGVLRVRNPSSRWVVASSLPALSNELNGVDAISRCRR